jgi:hypothetical protein
MAETYSTFPESQKRAPTLDELEDARQAALLYLKPTSSDDQTALVNLATVLTLTIQGVGEKAIADSLGITRGQVRIARRALRERKLLDDTLKAAVDRLTNEAVPLAVDNVIDKLESGDEKTTNRVLDTFGLGPAKGAGVTGDAPAVPKVPPLTLNFNLPPGVTVERANQLPSSGKVVGRGKDQPRIEKAIDPEKVPLTIDLPMPDPPEHG